jgi:hypothetical protein
MLHEYFLARDLNHSEGKAEALIMPVTWRRGGVASAVWVALLLLAALADFDPSTTSVARRKRRQSRH